MSLFDWFRRKPAAASPGAPAVQAASPNPHPAAVAGAKTVRAASDVVGQVPDHVPNNKVERMERREMLYDIVRDAMVRAGVLSASYKFKVLALDQRGKQFLVMMELARDYGGEMGRLSEIEDLIAQTARARNDITITGVYWRTSDTIASGVAQKGISPNGVSLPAAATPKAIRPRPAPEAAAAAVAAAAAAAAVVDDGPIIGSHTVVRTSNASRFDPIEPDEVAAFQRALDGNALQAAATQKQPIASSIGARAVPPLTGFEDTEIPHGEGATQDLSATQYGQLM